MNRLNKCVVACSCAEKWGWDQFGRKGNKDFWRAMLTLHRCPTCTRWLQSRAAGGGKGLMIACLPQSQVHLDFPTSSCKLALARLPMHEKTTGSDVLAHTEHFLFGHAVYCKWGAKKKTWWFVWKICKPNRVCVHTDTFFTFQSTLQTWKQLRKNRREMNFFSQGCGED